MPAVPRHRVLLAREAVVGRAASIIRGVWTVALVRGEELRLGAVS